ncbi:MAG TPA: type I-E CRISPR-associated protein Cas5/CasD [Gammaproteobacteria bacterium]|nr:type I-E CRISPR-associated protein Cas5/CasD [Gammaproteobacteria bacterium]
MKTYLLFRLYGPMSAWGDIAVGEQRPSAGHPSKSAVLGLLAAALGLRRDEEEQHRSLAAGYAIAVRVDVAGELLRDYHTTQVPPERRGVRYYTRCDELASDKLNTILSQRDYRMDASYGVAIWAKNDSVPWKLSALVSALLRPQFTLYLGRKSCPPSLPLQPRIIEANTLKEAFDGLPEQEGFLSDLPRGGRAGFYWESLSRDEAGFPDGGVHMVYNRRDQSLSRKRWQFAVREEHYFLEATVEEQE